MVGVPCTANGSTSGHTESDGLPDHFDDENGECHPNSVSSELRVVRSGEADAGAEAA